MGLSNNHENLTAAFIDNAAVIRVEGRGSFKISPPMKQFIQRAIDARSATRILIDMSDCIGMDSTFMGVVAGIACRIKSNPDVQFKLINLSVKNQKLLVTLGVDRVVDYSLSTTADERNLIANLNGEALEPDFADKLEAATTSLDAHKTLVDINPENNGKFKSVVELLQNDVDALKQQ
jgi:anti-anti-sigma regulatory factor